MENLLFLFAVQPRDAFDLRPHVVVPSPRSRIGLRAGAGALCAEQAAIRTDDFEQQFKRLHIVERRVEIELAQPLVEIFRVFRSAQLRAPPAHLIRHRAAAVGDDQLELGKVLEHFRIHQREDRDAFLSNEMAVERFAGILTARSVHQARDVHLNHLFIERVPVFLAHRRRLAVALAGIRVDHDADETQLVNATI